MTAMADEETTVASTEKLSIKQMVAGAIFLAAALGLSQVVPSIEIA